jgi:hypothetical protein
MNFDAQGGDWPATNRDIQAVRKHIFEVETKAVERDREARQRHERLANMIMVLHAHAVPGLRSAWTGRLVAVALIASFLGAVFGVVTMRAVTSDAQASEVRR